MNWWCSWCDAQYESTDNGRCPVDDTLLMCIRRSTTLLQPSELKPFGSVYLPEKPMEIVPQVTVPPMPPLPFVSDEEAIPALQKMEERALLEAEVSTIEKTGKPPASFFVRNAKWVAIGSVAFGAAWLLKSCL